MCKMIAMGSKWSRVVGEEIVQDLTWGQLSQRLIVGRGHVTVIISKQQPGEDWTKKIIT